MSVLDYGDIIYRHTSASVLKLLDPVYHSALRFITDAPYHTHHCALYEKVGWPSLAERRNIHWFLFIFKVLTGKQPSYLTDLLHWVKYVALETPLLINHKTATFSHNAPNSIQLLQD